MALFEGEIGLQFVTHLANHYSVPELVRLASLAERKGFQQIWLNDNIRYRSQMVVLTAIASRIPIRLGTAVLVPYFHHPLDTVDSFAALSELCDGREIISVSSGMVSFTWLSSLVPNSGFMAAVTALNPCACVARRWTV